VGPGLDTAETEACHTHGGADCCCGQRSQADEPEDVAETIQGRMKIERTMQQPSGGQCLERITNRNADRGPKRFVGADIGDERTKPDTRPDPVAQQEDSGDGDPRRGPDWRDLCGDERHCETKSRGGDVDSRQGEAKDNRTQPPDSLDHESSRLRPATKSA
jgi:hypothetical protein